VLRLGKTWRPEPTCIVGADVADGSAPRPQLVVFAGLPGTGKSTLAEHAARRLACPLFTKDYLEATLRRNGIGPEQNSGWAAYDLLTTLAEQQLRLGQSAVLDSTATFARVRAAWRDVAARYGASLRVVECVCSDEQLHRARLAGRQRGIPGWYELSWAEVERVRGNYEPWTDERLVLDAVDPVEQNVAALDRYLGG
jgi:predicted kinase